MNGDLGKGTGKTQPDQIVVLADEEQLSTLGLVWAMIWVIVRIGFVLAIWLVLQTGLFLGLFTVPLLLLMAFGIIWFVFDIGRNYPKMVARWRDRKRTDKRW